MVSTETDFDIGISAEGEALASIARDCSADLQAVGATVAFQARPAGVRASLEWLVPTAIAVFITHRYLGTLLDEAAKDHYPKLKAVFVRLARRTTGKDREVKLTVVSAGKVLDADPVVLSLWVDLRGSRRVVFRFDHMLSEDDFSAALDSLVDLLRAHVRNQGNDLLSQLPLALPSSPWAPIVMRFDVEQRRWRCWILGRHGEATLYPDESA